MIVVQLPYSYQMIIWQSSFNDVLDRLHRALKCSVSFLKITIYKERYGVHHIIIFQLSFNEAL
jgi:hypothetical protein